MDKKINIVDKQVFNEIVNEVNFLDLQIRNSMEIIYSRLEKLKEKFAQD